MKRLKLLPSVLMLVLCVGVLCMGIYAASPNSNQITGSITINPAAAAVNIQVWTENYDGTKVSDIQTLTDVRTGGNEVAVADKNGSFTLDFSSANAIGDVKPVYLKVKVINKSTTKTLGAYFARANTEDAAVFETSSDLTSSSKITATSLDAYAKVGVVAADTSDEAVLTMEFSANDFIESGSAVTLENLYLNITEYDSSKDSNQFTGSVNVNALNANVDVKAWIETDSGVKTEQQTLTGVNTNGTKKFNFLKGFTLDFESARHFAEVDNAILNFQITNLSGSQELGVYFAEKGSNITTQATKANVKLEDSIADGKIKVWLDMYSHINKKGSNGDVLTMSIRFMPVALIDGIATELNFGYDLNIENYVANMSNETNNSTSEGLVKLSSTYTSNGNPVTRTQISKSTFASTSPIPQGAYIVVPTSVTTISTYTRYSSETGDLGIDFYAISVPGTIKNIPTSTFNSSNSLKILTLHEGIESIANLGYSLSTSFIEYPKSLKTLAYNLLYTVNSKPKGIIIKSEQLSFTDISEYEGFWAVYWVKVTANSLNEGQTYTLPTRGGTGGFFTYTWYSDPTFTTETTTMSRSNVNKVYYPKTYIEGGSDYIGADNGVY